MSDYKPGTVAMVTVRRPKSWGGDGIRDGKTYLAFYDAYNRVWVTAKEGNLSGESDAWEQHVRPLVVLDLDKVCASGNGHGGGVAFCVENHTADYCALVKRVADQIREQTKPPRIDEPGLWGVVEAGATSGWADKRVPWLRRPDGWAPSVSGAFSRPRNWDDLIDPVLVREGVES